MNDLHTDYLDELFSVEDRRDAVHTALAFLNPRSADFDGFVGRGVSGLGFAAILAYEMNKPLTVVRKPEEDCHSSHRVEGYASGRLLFVDDFITTGKTLRKVLGALRHAEGFGRCRVVGVYTYRTQRCDTEREGIPVWNARKKPAALQALTLGNLKTAYEALYADSLLRYGGGIYDTF